MRVVSKGFLGPMAVGFLVFPLLLLTISSCVIADVNFEFDYQDPAGDVLEFNETWYEAGTVDTQPQIDIKWLHAVVNHILVINNDIELI